MKTISKIAWLVTLYKSCWFHHRERRIWRKPGTVRFRLSGVLVSVLATGTNGRGFKPCRGDRFLRAIEIRCTPPFGFKVKPKAPCLKILRHVKIPLTYLRVDTDTQNSHSFLQSSYSLPDVSAGRIARELWTRQAFSQSASSPWFSTLKYHLGDEQ
jgi:hypothetical protein